MKSILRIAAVLFAAVLLLLAAAFMFIEGRLLFSGDWLLHEVPVLAFLQYFARFVLAAAAACSAIMIFRKRK